MAVTSHRGAGNTIFGRTTKPNSDVVKLLEVINRMRDGLLRHGKHDNRCAYLRFMNQQDGRKPETVKAENAPKCDCGLDYAINGNSSE